jgi:hypothetical protein
LIKLLIKVSFFLSGKSGQISKPSWRYDTNVSFRGGRQPSTMARAVGHMERSPTWRSV